MRELKYQQYIREETTIIDAPNLEMTQKRNRDARVAWLTLTYRL